jgi:hypothetical protein
VHFANQIYFFILKSEERFFRHIRKNFVYLYTYKTTKLPHHGVPNRKSFLPQMGSKLTATLKQEYLLHREKFTQKNSFLFCIYLI